LTPYQRHRQITAAVKAWRAWLTDPDRRHDPDASRTAQALVGFLDAAGLQLLPRCSSYADWRVIVDGKPAPSNNNPDRPSGPMDADEAADAFLRAALQAETAGADSRIVVRPATDHELVAKLAGSYVLRPDPVTVQVVSWALLQLGDRPALAFTDDTGTVIEASFDDEGFRDFAHAMGCEAADDDDG
jgi:hypothetical protein